MGAGHPATITISTTLQCSVMRRLNEVFTMVVMLYVAVWSFCESSVFVTGKDLKFKICIAVFCFRVEGSEMMRGHLRYDSYI